MRNWLFCLIPLISLNANPLAIIGGQDQATTTAYGALIFSPTTVSPLTTGLSTGTTLNSVAINPSGYSIIGGVGSIGAAYAAFVSPTGQLQSLTGLPSLGTLLSVTINDSKEALIGGFDGAFVSYAARVSSTGVVTQLSTPLGSSVIFGVSLNPSNTGLIVGGVGAAPYAAYVSPTNAVSSIAGLPVTGLLISASIQSSGNGIIGGAAVANSAYAALVYPSSPLVALTGLPASGFISSVAMNSSEVSIIGGGFIGGAAYAAFVTPSATVTSLSNLPVTGVINDVAINSVGKAILGGINSGAAYAAFVSTSDNIVHPLPNLPASGQILSVAINSFGAAIIGGQNGAAAYAALIAPNGTQVIPLSNIPATGIINSVAILDVIPTEGLSGNNLIFADYINEFATQVAWYFVPAFYDGTLADALMSAAPTRNAVSFYTACNNLFYLTTSIAAHTRNRHFIERGQERETTPEPIAALSIPRCPEKKESPYTLWFEAIGALAYQKAQSQTVGFDPATGGGLLAFEVRPSTHTRVGGLLSYLYTHIHEKEGAGKSHINQEDLFLYASWENRHFYVDGAIGGGPYQTNQVRKIHLTGFDFRSSSKPHGWQLVPHLELGFNGKKPTHSRTVEIYFNPFAMVDWANAWQSKYKEKGSGPFNVGQKRHHASLLRTEAGMRFYEVWSHNTWNLIFQEKGSYVNTQSFGAGKVNAFLVGSPGSFTVETLASSQNLGVGQCAIIFNPLRAWYPITTLFYQGEFGAKYQSHQINLELDWDF